MPRLDKGRQTESVPGTVMKKMARATCKSKSGQWKRPNWDTVIAKLGQVGFVTIPTYLSAWKT
jgi:hypothetical protein